MAAGLGLAAALSLAATASDLPADHSPVAAPAASTPLPEADRTIAEEPATESLEILLGGVSNARDAEWGEASNLPALPVVAPDAFEAEFITPPSAPED